MDNLFTGSKSNMLELADLVRELTGSKSEIVFLPLSQDDPTQRKPVIELVRKELDWEPKIALREGLEKTIAYFDAQLKNH